jgi:hypothetical protein
MALRSAYRRFALPDHRTPVRIAFPVASITDIQEGVVHLKLRKHEVAALPSVKLRHEKSW